jgi:hypothetical protein
MAMASQRPLSKEHYEQPKQTPLHKGLQNVKNEIDQILAKMKKDAKFSPKQDRLNDLSAEVVQLIQKYHPKISAEQKNLLTAVIDLNEVPLMHPTMQRVAYETALKDASANIERYLINN